MTQLIIAIAAFIVALGILVTFHEFGHFWVARKLGVKVLRFSVGFGKPLFRRRGKDGVDYVIAAIPLGGYVKMLDEREGPVPEDQIQHAFNRQPLLSRTLIVLAGPVFNFVFAIFAYWLMFMIGTIGLAPIIGEITPDSIAAQAKLEPKMEFVQIADIKTQNWQQVVNGFLPYIGEDTIDITLKYPDSDVTKKFDLNLAGWRLDSHEPDVLAGLGIVPFKPKISTTVGGVVENTPADDIGLQVNDRIAAVNDKPVEFWHEFVHEIMPYANQQVKLTVDRAGDLLTFDVTLGSMMHQGKEVGFLGVMITPTELPKEFIRKERYGAWDSFVKALERTWHYIALTFKLIGKMITGDIGLKSISGPITIAQGAGATATIGFAYYLGFLGLISVSLGVINLLPIPVLDGGHLMFYLIEAILRRPPSEKFMQVSYQIGLLLLIGLMTLAFYNDIARLS